MQAIILAAGKGLRLKPYTDHSPKGLVSIAGKPLLEWTIMRLPKQISSIHIVVGYLGEQIKSHFGENFHNLPLTYSTQDPLNGTGSALFCAKDFCSGKFLVINGDDIYDKQDLAILCATDHWGMLCIKTTSPLSGAVVTNSEGNITSLHEERSESEKLLNCGAYLLDESVFNLPLASIQTHAGTEYSLPHTLVQQANHTQVRAVLATSWLPIGTPQELANAEKIMHNVSEAVE